MANNKRWTPAEEKVIIDNVNKYPTNLTFSFEESEKQLVGRTKASIQLRYHGTIAKRTEIILATGTSTGLVINTKVSARTADDKKLFAGTMGKRLIVTALSQMSKDQAIEFLVKSMDKKTQKSVARKIVNAL